MEPFLMGKHLFNAVIFCITFIILEHELNQYQQAPNTFVIWNYLELSNQHVNELLQLLEFVYVSMVL